ncbi:MAG: guanylate kinase [Dehalococcoidales bacterium]|nr:guanylate kinase [Dehalococcoidales bacterium]
MKSTNPKSQFSFNLKPRQLLVVLSGPSGVGKDAILNRMRELNCPLEFITTVTTRSRRVTERNNIEYHFVTREKFREMIARNEFIEHAEVYGNYYGVPKLPIKAALEQHQDVIVKVDIQGAQTIKRLAPQGIFIFIITPTLEELKDRLSKRHTESAFDLSLRLKTAESELEQLHLFDYIVVNRRDQIDGAVSDINAIIQAEKCRLVPREVSLS